MVVLNFLIMMEMIKIRFLFFSPVAFLLVNIDVYIKMKMKYNVSLVYRFNIKELFSLVRYSSLLIISLIYLILKLFKTKYSKLITH